MLILREEKFGGIAFNANAGVRLHLDHEGFSALRQFAAGHAPPPAVEPFLSSVCRELELPRRERFLLRPSRGDGLAPTSFSVLRAPLLVDLQITNHCNLRCPHCYMASSSAGTHAPFADILLTLDQCAEVGVLEVALGGGEPTTHPRFADILRAARQRHLVCNLATNGKSMTPRLARLLARHCGAVALSVEFLGDAFELRRGYPFAQFLAAARMVQQAGLRLVFQLTVSRANLETIAETTAFLARLKPEGVVFLTYKPVGRGKYFDAVLSGVNPQTVARELERCFRTLDAAGIRIGYDCCLGNLLAGSRIAGDAAISGCSATRDSIAITMNLDVLPCSFTQQISLGNLRRERLSDIWRNQQTRQFRQMFTQRITADPTCRSCPFNTTCLGGCPVFDLVGCGIKKAAPATARLAS